MSTIRESSCIPSLTPTLAAHARPRVRHEAEFEDLNLLSASSRVPLITLWGASWCPSCKVITPLLRELIESGVGEEQGGVAFAEVQLDSPTLGTLATRYTVCWATSSHPMRH